MITNLSSPMNTQGLATRLPYGQTPRDSLAMHPRNTFFVFAKQSAALWIILIGRFIPMIGNSIVLSTTHVSAAFTNTLNWKYSVTRAARALEVR
jgi:hypothetical protein